MKRVLFRLLAGATVMVPCAAAAQSNAIDSAFAACAARDTSTMWQRVSSEWSADTGKWTNDSLRQALIALGKADQATRTVTDFGDSVQDPAFVRHMNRSDSANASALMAIVNRVGWPTRSMVGVEGSEAAFLIAQHNTPIQHQVLRLMQAAPPGQVSPVDLAMLDDRVQVSDGKSQRFGTQISMTGNGPAKFDSIADVAHLDQRRAAAGLPPIPVYICMMRVYSGREIVDPRGGGH